MPMLLRIHDLERSKTGLQCTQLAEIAILRSLDFVGCPPFYIYLLDFIGTDLSIAARPQRALISHKLWWTEFTATVILLGVVWRLGSSEESSCKIAVIPRQMSLSAKTVASKAEERSAISSVQPPNPSVQKSANAPCGWLSHPTVRSRVFSTGTT